jgi:hypothetical protein
MAIKAESRNRLVHQAVKQKLQIKSHFLGSAATPAPEDVSYMAINTVRDQEAEDIQDRHKAEMLLGTGHVPPKKGLARLKNVFSKK